MDVMARTDFIPADNGTPSESRLTKEWVPLPHLGEGKGLYVRLMKSKELDTFETAMVGKEDKERLDNLRARLVCFTACDADGIRIFSNADAAALGETDHLTMDLLFDASRNLNKIFQTQKQREEAEKN